MTYPWDTDEDARAIATLLGRESDIEFISTAQLSVLQFELSSRFGGLVGVRDKNLLDSAANRPILAASYDESIDAIAASALLAVAIVHNHPFLDSNKRTGYFGMALMLMENGISLRPDPKEAVKIMRLLAKGEVSDEHFTSWVRGSCVPTKDCHSPQTRPRQ